MNLNKLDSSWDWIIPLLETPDIIYLKEEILSKNNFQPASSDIFNVFSMPIEDIKVVILGQDPYPTPNDAIGIAFAVPNEKRVPASLRIIQKELYNEGVPLYCVNSLGKFCDEWKTLSHWTEQGIFLLNTALTVENRKADSHTKYWESFMIEVIKNLSIKKKCIWVLWGRKAQKYKKYIEKSTAILEAAHPASESYSRGNSGFYGCNHFSMINDILIKNKLEKINW